jgi:hypothetical protein
MPAAQPTPQLGGAAYLRLILLGAAIGIPAAFVAALFLALVHDLEHWLCTTCPRRSTTRPRRGSSSSDCRSWAR